MSDRTSESTDSDDSSEAGEVTVAGQTVPEEAVPDDVPEWDDEYVDRVSGRLMFNYDLEKDHRIRGRAFTMHGELRMESQKHFLHPSVNYANYEAREHLFVERAEAISRADLDELVELGHDLADEWIDADEEHYGTEFTFAVVVPEIPDAIGEYVAGFRDRNLLKFGYYGHYEVNLLVVAPDDEAAVESENADVAAAFRTWADVPDERPGLLARLVSAIRG